MNDLKCFFFVVKMHLSHTHNDDDILYHLKQSLITDEVLKFWNS